MNNHILPQWAKQVKREKILKLYSLNAIQIYDEELVDEVSYAMFARANSIIKVTKAHQEGILDCPSCSHIINFNTKKSDYIALCGKCGWNMTRVELHGTYKGKQLVGGAAMPIIEDAVKSFPAKGTYTDKIIWIDSLIHSFHGELNEMHEQTGLAFRPIARNFIEGTQIQVIELILSLAYGDSPDFIRSRAEWIEKLKISYVSNDIKDVL
jgi:uncharacterized protein (DUF433 family)